ncbi:MAG: PcfJ domain-containing protein [Akkermansiaceae bacterium]
MRQRREIVSMKTYTGEGLSTASAAQLASKFIKGHADEVIYPRPVRSQKRAYHLYQLKLAFRKTKGNSSFCLAADSLFKSIIQNCELLEIIDHQKWNAVAFLLRLCRYHNQWVNSPVSWYPKDILTLPSCQFTKRLSGNNRMPFDQLRSLIRHLLGKYPLPGFWDVVWFQSDKINFLWMDWYVDLSAGKSYQSLKKLPCQLTKKSLHLSSNAPDDLQPLEAFRWGQLRSQNIPESICNIITHHKCATDYENDHVWLPLFRLFQSEIEKDEILRLCTYVHQRRHECFNGDSYETRGKTLASIIREMNEFYQQNPDYIMSQKTKQRRTKRRQKVLRWESQKRYEEWFDYDPENDVTYSIEELCKSFQLISEGRKMSHCVATYVSRCINGESSIWSLRSYRGGKRNNHVTIEVSPFRNRIIQAQASNNSDPIEADWERICKWAELNKLSF